MSDVGYLGGYALDPTTNDICFKTQVAVRSVILTANEWEHFMGSGEDLAADKEADVKEWLKPALESYAKEAQEAVERVHDQLETSKEPLKSKLRLLQVRWEQIRIALEGFLKDEIPFQQG